MNVPRKRRYPMRPFVQPVIWYYPVGATPSSSAFGAGLNAYIARVGNR